MLCKFGWCWLHHDDFERIAFLICRYGPHGGFRPGYEFSEQGELNCHVKYAPFSLPAWVNGGDTSKTFVDGLEKQASVVVRHALSSAVNTDSFPKCSVDIHVEILQCDGGA